MNIKKTIITAVVALTTVAMIAPMTAGASTITDLQASIAQLTAQLNSLQGSTSTTTTTGSMPGACVGITFTRNLRVGSTGSDVKCFQTLMNTHGFQLAASGAGSPGNETMYFGLRTLGAVQRLQAAQGWTPASQVGPLTRGLFNAWLSGTSNTTTTTTTTTGNNPPVQTGPVNVMLASDTPAAGGSVVGGQATAPLASFVFSGNGTVTSITLKRSGVSDQNTLSNVYLYDGNTRLTDGYGFNINGQIVMNGLSINVAGTREIWVKADAATGAANTSSSIAVSLTGYTANGSTQTANVMGNMQYIVIGNLATAGLGANTITGSPTVNAGTTSYTFWSAPLQINTRAVWLKGANFRMIGSAPSDALGNIKMFIDGADTGKVATVIAVNGSNYAMFDLSAAPISLMTGSHTVDMRADIQKGSNRTIQVSIQQAADLTLFDGQMGVNIAVGGPGNNSTTPVAFSGNSGASVTINTGSATVVIDPSFQVMTNVSGGSTNVVIGRFKVHAYGEDVKVNSLIITPLIASAAATGCTTNAAGVGTGSCGLNNVTLYFNGGQVGTQQNLPTAGGSLTYQLGSQLIAPAGTDSWLEIRADLQTITSVNYTSGTVSVNLVVGASNAQGQTSLATLNFPGAAISGTTLAVQTGNLVVSTNTGYLSQNANPNTAGVKIGSFILQNQSTSESVRITSLLVALSHAVPTFVVGGSTTNVTTTQTWVLNSVAGITVGNVLTLGGTIGCTIAPIMTVASINTGTNTLTSVTTGNTASTGSACSTGALVIGSGVTTGPATITNFSGLRTSETSGSGSTPIQPTASNTFSVNKTLSTGQSTVLDVFADTSTANMGTVVATLTVTSIGVTSNVSTISSAIPGQTITMSSGTVATPTLLTSSTTVAQFVAAGPSGVTNATKASFNFVSNGGASAITELKFTVTGSNTVTNICVGTICAAPVSGVAYLTGLNVNVPLGGGGVNVDALISYSGVGQSGITSGTASSVTLTFVKYTSGGVTTTINPSVPAPTMTMVGSKPTVTITNATVTGLINSAENKIGEVTIAADAGGNVKINDIVFSVGFSGYTAGFVITAPRIADGSTTITGSGCAADATVTSQVFCEFGTSGNTFATSAVASTEVNTDFDGFVIPAGTSKVFSLYGTVGGTQATTGQHTVSTSLRNYTTNAFNWDDTASATFVADASTANPASGTNLTGASIYNFPTNSYAIHD